MVKKIKKYLKFVVCCALIMNLVAPSYAALSASDGSAFVTKAEFDAALADFSSRLTTFEAGINSKIDSQVTSYLDRNGIWSGKLQTLNTTNLATVNTMVDSTIFKPISGTVTITRNGFGMNNNNEREPGNMRGYSWGTGAVSVNIFQVQKVFTSGWYIGHTQASNTDVRDETLFVANKSGLVFAPYVMFRNKGSASDCWAGGTNVSWAVGHPSYGIAWSSIFKFAVNGNVKASMIQSRTLPTSLGWSPVAQWDSTPAEEVNGTAMFFVSAGDDVHLKRAWSIGGNQSLYIVTQASFQGAVASTISFPAGILIY